MKRRFKILSNTTGLLTGQVGDFCHMLCCYPYDICKGDISLKASFILKNSYAVLFDSHWQCFAALLLWNREQDKTLL